MSHPKFSIGEAVMVRCVERQEENVDFSIITEIADCMSEHYLDKNDEKIEYGIWYQLSHNKKWFIEEVLRPIPKEKGSSWDDCVWRPNSAEITA